MRQREGFGYMFERIKSNGSWIILTTLLSKLDKVPDFVGQDSYSEIDAIRKSVQRLLDDLHIDDIFKRICVLSDPLRKDLIIKLREL